MRDRFLKILHLKIRGGSSCPPVSQHFTFHYTFVPLSVYCERPTIGSSHQLDGPSLPVPRNTPTLAPTLRPSASRKVDLSETHFIFHLLRTSHLSRFVQGQHCTVRTIRVRPRSLHSPCALCV